MDLAATVRSDDTPPAVGDHVDGELVNRFTYWMDLAHVRGRDGSTSIRGLGLDVGSTYTFRLPLKPAIAIGYAFGTGDPNPDDHIDRSFRQSGLQYNSDQLTGVTWFKYYGELFDPDLSNLSIFTGAMGIRPTRKSPLSSSTTIISKTRRRRRSGTPSLMPSRPA